MKRIAIIFVCLFFSFLSRAYEERNILTGNFTKEDLRGCIVTGQKWFPYPLYTDRTGWDKLFGESKELYIKEGEKYLGYTWQYVKTSAYLAYETTGDRMIMQNPYESNIDAVGYLMRAELAEGKGRFIPDLIDGTICLCEMTSWALSAHLVGAQTSHRAIPDIDEPVVALRQSKVAEMLAMVWFWFHEEFDKTSPVIARRLRNELQLRMLDPFMARDDYGWMGLTEKSGTLNNWTSCCSFNAMMCFMLLENDPDKLVDGVYKAVRCVDKLLNSVSGDGACDEGPGYWKGNAGMIINFLSALKLVSGGKLDFLNHPFIRRMAEFYVHCCVDEEWMTNFSDAEPRYSYTSYPLIFRFGVDVQSPLLMAFGAEGARKQGKKDFSGDILPRYYSFFQELEILRHCEEMDAYHEPVNRPSFVWYPDSKQCFLHNGRGMFLAAKASHNGESHNHNDVGSGIFYINDIPVLIDAGRQVYTRQTFGKERYSLWNNQSQYHNTPSINGVMQKAGKAYKATDVKMDSLRHTFSSDIAGAYPEDAKVKSWVRSWTLGKEELVIHDKFILSQAIAPNTVNFLTWGKPSLVEDGRIVITTERGSACLEYNSRQLTPSIEEIPLSDELMSHTWGPAIYRIVLTARQLQTSGSYRFTLSAL